VLFVVAVMFSFVIIGQVIGCEGLAFCTSQEIALLTLPPKWPVMCWLDVKLNSVVQTTFGRI